MVEESQAAPPAAQPAPPPQKPWYNPFLTFFSSVHVAVVILILLAAISIIGTVLQQEAIADPAENLRIFQQFFSSPAVAERAYVIAEKLGFYRLYHTWYFYTLLGMLSTSLIVCSLRRLPQVMQIMGRPKIELEESGFRASPNRRALTVALPPAATADAVAAVLKKAGFAVRPAEREGERFLFGQKGTYSRLGIYVTHLSILVIFVGGIIGSLAGFKGYMQIVEGESSDQVVLRGNQGRLTLPFQVRCDDFTVENYPGTSRPKDYYSELTVLQGGAEVMKEKIEVNSPLQYDGIWLYQSSYGDTGRGMRILLRAADPKTGASQELVFTDTKPREVPGTGVRLQVQQIYPDFVMGEDGLPTSRSNQPRNPVVLARVTLPDGSTRQTYLFQLRPDIKMVADLPLDLTFVKYEGLQYTGLQVVYDPGVWVIWVGCTLMILGLWIAFFVSHRRIWVRLREEQGRTAVALAGNANKNRERFTEEFERLGDALQALAASRA